VWDAVGARSKRQKRGARRAEDTEVVGKKWNRQCVKGRCAVWAYVLNEGGVCVQNGTYHHGKRKHKGRGKQRQEGTNVWKKRNEAVCVAGSAKWYVHINTAVSACSTV